MGLSDGRVPAQITFYEPSQFNPRDRDTWPQVRYLWETFADQHGVFLTKQDLTDIVHPRTITPAVGTEPFPPPTPMNGSHIPELGVVIFRWGGRNEVQWPSQWGDTGSPVSDTYIRAMVEQGIAPLTHHDFETWTVFVEESIDLERFADSAHLVLAGHPVMRCARVCAMYFLYPTTFEESCQPFIEVGSDSGAAYVDSSSLLRCMRTLERLGIQTGFPHPADLYEILAGKTWTFSMSLAPQFKVPCTVRLPRHACDNAIDGANMALKALNRVRTARGLPPTDEGVAKLGFSWEALDVKHFQGFEALVRALKLTHEAEFIDGSLCGQAHKAAHIIVQEYVKHDLEMRVYVVDGHIEDIHYTRFERIDDCQCFKDFNDVKREECLMQWFDGDEAALQQAEQQARDLVGTWNEWLAAQICESVPAVRFDFFVRRDGKGSVELYTAEICEVGFSMFDSRQLPSKVFKAAVHAVLRPRHQHVMSFCEDRPYGRPMH